MKKITSFLCLVFFILSSMPLSSIDSDSEPHSRERPRKRARIDNPREAASSSAVFSSADTSVRVSSESSSENASDESDSEVAEDRPEEHQREPRTVTQHPGKHHVPKVKVYLIKNAEYQDYADFLNTTSSDGKKRDFTDPYPCRVNPNTWWYGQHKTRTRPRAWNLISEGTGIDINEANETNVGEHWVCFIVRGEHIFAVTFGKAKLLKDECVDQEFGKRVIRNIAASSTSERSGNIVAILPDAREHELLGRQVKGKDYCQITRKTKLRELPLICNQLWEISESGIGDAYHEVQNHLIPINDLSGRGIGPLREGESVTIDGVVYIKIFNRLYQMHADYLNDLNTFISSLIGEQPPVGALREHQRPEDEGEYNERMAANYPDHFLLLDQKEVTGIEVCDLLNVPRSILIHVKIGTKGANLNHLFGQGQTSAELLVENEEHRRLIPLKIAKLTILKMICDHFNNLLKPITAQLNRDLKTLFDLHKKLKRAARVQMVKVSTVSHVPSEKSFNQYSDRTTLEVLRNLQSGDAVTYRNLFLKLQTELAKYRYLPLRDKINRIFKGNEALGVFIDKVQNILNLTTTVAKDFLLPKAQLLRDYERLGQFVRDFNPGNTTIVFGICVPQERLLRENVDMASLIPLGPRIILRKSAIIMHGMGFTIRVQYIPSMGRDDDVEEEAVPPSLPFNARTPAQQTEIERRRQRDELLAPEEYRIENRIRAMAVAPEQPMPDENSFNTPLTTGDPIQPYRQLRVLYPEGTVSDGVTLFDTYVLGPTIGNGNCFFHAALTEVGLDKVVMENRIAEIRASLPEVVMENPDYSARIKREILAEYKSPPHRGVPEQVRKMLKQNDHRDSLRNDTIVFLRDKHILENPDVAYNDYDPSPLLPDFLRVVPYNDEQLLATISDDELRRYIQRYVENRGRESYITIPAGHGESSAIGSIIAEQEDALIHCFMFDSRRKMLNYKGSIGNPNAQKVVSILYHSEHYWALYNAGEVESRRRGILQAAINESSH